MITTEQRKIGQASYAALYRARLQYGVRSTQYAVQLKAHAAVVRESIRQAIGKGAP
jgi:hypothetical protein